MSKTLYPPILTVGIGNEYRHDDAAGLLIVRRMLQLIEPSPDITVLQMDGDGAALLEAWEHARSVLLIDTALLVDEPGTNTNVASRGIEQRACVARKGIHIEPPVPRTGKGRRGGKQRDGRCERASAHLPRASGSP